MLRATLRATVVHWIVVAAAAVVALSTPTYRRLLATSLDVRAPLVAIQEVKGAMIERGEGAILNLSSVAGLNPVPSLMVYGMAKAALEFLTVAAARELAPHSIPVNTFRIDVPVASEGFVHNFPGADTSDWEPCEVAAEGIIWMLQQPPSYTGHNASMTRLREQHVAPGRLVREQETAEIVRLALLARPVGELRVHLGPEKPPAVPVPPAQDDRHAPGRGPVPARDPPR